MGFFDSLKHSFHPEVRDTLNDLKRNYRKGLDAFCRGTGGSYGSYQFRRIVITDNMSYSDMKYIYDFRDSIKELHETILQSEQIEKDYKEVETLQRQYPHAFISICQECLKGIIFDSHVEMPGSKRKHNPSQVSSRIVNVPLQKKYYGGQYNPIGCNIFGTYNKIGGTYKCEPKKIRDLIYSDVQKILDYRSLFREKEDCILLALENERVEEKFNDIILSNEKRKKFYKEFLIRNDKKVTDKGFVVDNILGLDCYISQQIRIKAEEIKLKYPNAMALIAEKGYQSDYATDELILEKEDVLAIFEIPAQRYLQLKKKYPQGLPAFERYNTYDDGKNSAGLTLDEIVECEDQIAEFERFADIHRRFKSWEKEQSEFASISRNLCPEHFGCYWYDIDFSGIREDGSSLKGNYRVWQTFYKSFYDLMPGTSILDDYKYLTDRASENQLFLSGTLNYKESVYDKIFDLVCSYRNKFGDISVVFASNGLDCDKSFAFNHTKLEFLIEKIEDAGIPYYEGEADLVQDKELTRHILIIEFITINSRLRSTVEFIREKYKDLSPLIAYFSFRKGYDFLEIENIINREEQKKKVQKEKEEAEKRRIKEEKERKEREKEERRQVELRLKKESEEVKNTLVAKVRNWPNIRGVIHCFSILKYFPTTCDFDATESEWEDRWTVWNFKNTPGKTSNEDHEEALNIVIPKLKSILVNTFGKDNLKELTLVCIPASSAVKTNARYEEFSRKICEETGMYNAYDYIKVISSCSEKKFGGSGITTDNLSLDCDFFKRKNVILFDDVITKGDSMIRFKYIMESLGANVICGLSIGKTTHSR